MMTPGSPSPSPVSLSDDEHDHDDHPMIRLGPAADRRGAAALYDIPAATGSRVPGLAAPAPAPRPRRWGVGLRLPVGHGPRAPVGSVRVIIMIGLGLTGSARAWASPSHSECPGRAGPLPSDMRRPPGAAAASPSDAGKSRLNLTQPAGLRLAGQCHGSGLTSHGLGDSGSARRSSRSSNVGTPAGDRPWPGGTAGVPVPSDSTAAAAAAQAAAMQHAATWHSGWLSNCRLR
jgi:hypothetical protein